MEDRKEYMTSSKAPEENISRIPQISLELVERISDAACEAKGRDLLVLDVSKLFSEAQYFVIVSGRSDRQVQGITNRIIDTLEEDKVSPISIEGLEEGQWTLVDFGEVIVHVFYEPVRDHYDLEGLWAKAPRLSVAAQSESLRIGEQAA